MARTKGVKKYKEKWVDISNRVCRRLGVPNGSSFKVVYDNSTKARVQRADTLYERKGFGSLREKLEALVAENARVKAVIDTFSPYIYMDLGKEGAKIVAYGPDNKPIAHHTTLASWRNREGRETDDEREARLLLEEEIEETAREGAFHLDQLEEMRTADVVIKGLLRTLARTYGPEMLREAIKEERLS